MLSRLIKSMLILVLLSGCGGITLIDGPSRDDLYSKNFLTKIGSIKEMYRQGDSERALHDLQMMSEQTLMPTEQALRRNLVGVIYFSQAQYEKAISNFEVALTRSSLDKSLYAQIYLNMASSYYKIGYMEKAFLILSKARAEHLSSVERKKYHVLKFKSAKELGRDEDEVRALISYLSDIKDLGSLKDNQFFQHLMTGYFQLGQRQRIRVLEEFDDGDVLCVSYLGYLEGEKLYYGGKKEDAKDFLEWVSDKSKAFPEIASLVDGFFFKISNYSKVDRKSIGIVLPLSNGRRVKYSQRTLRGIDVGLIQKLKSRGYKVFIKDSEGSGVVGAHRVRELIETDHVAAIIGGLYSNEAEKEYLEAKKHGTLFISLSQIYLPKEEKDHLLVEVTGSVESEINKVFSPEMLSTFGKRAAIVYPEGERGKAYVDEFWRKAQVHGIDVSGVISYEKNKTDYRNPIKNLLGLSFSRERQEEMGLLSEIYSMEKRRSTRRIQILKPQVDFDWVFIPALPKDAMQLIPSFKYFDAYPVNIVGVHSWRSKALKNESTKFGKLYFVGDEINQTEMSFVNDFKNQYRRKPKLIELRAYDSFSIVDSFLQNAQFETRDEIDIYIRKKQTLKALTGSWTQQDGIWVKNMTTMRLKRGKFDELFKTEEQEKM